MQFNKKVYCLDDGSEYTFTARNGYEAVQKMQYYLDAVSFDKDSTIKLCNNRTWELVHDGMTYASLA